MNFNDTILSIISQILGLVAVYIIVWIGIGRWLAQLKIQPQKRAGWIQIRGEIINNIIVLSVASLLTGTLFALDQSGIIKIYTDINQYGIIYFILSIVIYLLVNDGWFYLVHRTLHRPSLYSYIHAVHHKSLDVTPFTTYSFHIIESILINIIIFPLLIVVPISIAGIGIIQVIGLLNNLKSHLGYEFFPRWFDRTPLKCIINSTHHNLHHTRYNGNYGLMFTFWDKWLGTEFSDQAEVTNEVKNRPRNSRIQKNDQYHQLQVQKKVYETPDTVSLYFQPKDNNFFTYKPGQHLNIRVKVGGIWYERVFSLSSTPNLDDFLRITTKKHSVVTQYFFDKIQVNDTLQSLYPAGDFGLKSSSGNTINNYLFVAGGSGITPIISMIRSILVSQSDVKITLFYANRDQKSIIFESELEALQKKYAQCTIRYFISGQSRIGQDDIIKNLTKKTQLYICGPDSLKQSVLAYAQNKIEKSSMHTEYFAHGHLPIFSRIFLSTMYTLLQFIHKKTNTNGT